MNLLIIDIFEVKLPTSEYVGPDYCTVEEILTAKGLIILLLSRLDLFSLLFPIAKEYSQAGSLCS